jgi:hypothetical protein
MGNWIVNCVAFNRFKAGFFNQLNQFGLRHLYLIVSLDRVTLRQFATFSDCAVDIVCAKV